MFLPFFLYSSDANIFFMKKGFNKLNYYFSAIEIWIVLNSLVSFFLNIFTLRSVLFVFTLHVAKAKRLRDENKNEQMNRFVNNFMANLSEEEKKLSFLTNQARALRAYSEGSMQRVSK